MLKLLKNEKIRCVNGFKGLYWVSSFGRVYSKHKSARNKYGMFLKPRVWNNSKRHAYEKVILYKNGKKKSMTVHRLVLESFNPNTFNKPQINHIDGNKVNNHISNLEWCTASENAQHREDTGLGGRQKISKKVCIICELDYEGVYSSKTCSKICRTEHKRSRNKNLKQKS